MLVTHGTSERYTESILRNGLTPRGLSGGNWEHTVPSNSRAVYFTTVYGLHFAKNCSAKEERLAVWEFDTDSLIPELLAPDEDFLEQVTRGQPKFEKAGKTMNARTLWFRKRSLSEFSHHWSQSLELMGTGTYYGRIPAAALTRVAYVPHNHVLAQMSDPSVGIQNHKICGAYYRNLTKLTFKETDDLEDDAYWALVLGDGELPNLSEIEVVDLKKGK